MDTLTDEIKKQGYSLNLKLNSEELNTLKYLIEKQAFRYIASTNILNQEKVKKNKLSLANYHRNFPEIEHEKIWGKENRILSKFDSDFFLKKDFFRKLNSIFGHYKISDEMNLGYENFVWRIVRPNSKNDIGPPHRDCWFWDLNPNFPKPKYKFSRFKVWIPIFCEADLSGLALEPYSHKRLDIEYDSIALDGINKPRIKKDQKTNLKLIKTNPGDAIIFHDKLLHCGMNKGNASYVRVSIEFTLLVKK